MIGYFICSILILIFYLLSIDVIDFFTTFICIISIYKSVIRIKNYRTININKESNYNKNIYKKYRIRIGMFWFGFLVICFFAKKILKISSYYFLAGVFFLFSLDIFFYTSFCLLNKIANFRTNSKLKCCYTCPVRGWDLLMLILPTVFISLEVNVTNKILIIIACFLSLICLIYWEMIKKYLVSDYANHKKCKNTCGEEYFGKRKCNRYNSP